MTEEKETVQVNRAEWTAVVAILLNVATIIFIAGTLWQQSQDHARRIELIEARYDEMVITVARIDENVEYLAERAREDREKAK
jgi:cytochrome oxidase assembly protein ShyY1